MHRKLSGNRYWGVVIGEFAGGDFLYLFFALLSMNLIILGVLVSAIHRQVDTASSNHLQSEIEHLLPLFCNASATFFSVVFNYAPIFNSYVLSIRVLSYHVLSYHVFARSFALLTFFYSSNAILFCYKPKAAASHSSITAKSRHTRSRGFRLDGK